MSVCHLSLSTDFEPVMTKEIKASSNFWSNHAPSHFCKANSDWPSPLISFSGFDFREWEWFGDRHGIASISLHYEDRSAHSLSFWLQMSEPPPIHTWIEIIIIARQFIIKEQVTLILLHSLMCFVHSFKRNDELSFIVIIA